MNIYVPVHIYGFFGFSAILASKTVKEQEKTRERYINVKQQCAVKYSNLKEGTTRYKKVQKGIAWYSKVEQGTARYSKV